MKKNRSLLLLTLIVAVVASCKKENTSSPPPKVTTGLFVLSEGLFGNNNTMLTYYSTTTNAANTDFYAKANGSGLGDTGNDFLIYGGKMYIVMNVSSYVEVANATTAATIKKIAFKTTGGVERQPRYIIAYQNKVLVSAWDGTVAVIDTASLTIDKNITVGPNPEQMAIVGDKLYVTNSGGLNPVPDSTVSVISLTTMTELQKVKAWVNPGSITADASGNIYVACTGDYGSIKPRLVKINTATNAVVKTADTAAGKIVFHDGFLYATGGYLGSANVRKLSLTDFSQQTPNFVTDGTVIRNPYGLNIDPDNGDVYVTDAKDYITSGEVFCFDKTGRKKFSFSVTPALNPNKVVLIKQ